MNPRLIVTAAVAAAAGYLFFDVSGAVGGALFVGVCSLVVEFFDEWGKHR